MPNYDWQHWFLFLGFTAFCITLVVGIAKTPSDWEVR